MKKSEKLNEAYHAAQDAYVAMYAAEEALCKLADLLDTRTDRNIVDNVFKNFSTDKDKILALRESLDRQADVAWEIEQENHNEHHRF